jgi:hypothetical protein
MSARKLEFNATFFVEMARLPGGSAIHRKLAA